MSKTILKAYANGDLEILGTPLVQLENLFVKHTSQGGELYTSGTLGPVGALGEMTSDFIRVEGSQAYTVTANWVSSTLGTLQWAWFLVCSYDNNKNFINASLEINQTMTNKRTATFTTPSSAAYIRVSASHLNVPSTTLQFVRGSQEKTYTLSIKDLENQGMPVYSFSKESIQVPPIVKYVEGSSMPHWVADTGNPISFFKEGIVIKGNLIQS